jgi:hypothetical protein
MHPRRYEQPGLSLPRCEQPGLQFMNRSHVSDTNRHPVWAVLRPPWPVVAPETLPDLQGYLPGCPAATFSSHMRIAHGPPPATCERTSSSAPIDQKPRSPMPYWPCRSSSRRCSGVRFCLRVADVSGDIGERFGARELGDHALAVIEHAEGRQTALAHARDCHHPCLRVDRVLHQLGERLTWIGLRAREPADQLERIGGAKASGADVGACRATHRAALVTRRAVWL